MIWESLIVHIMMVTADGSRFSCGIVKTMNEYTTANKIGADL